MAATPLATGTTLIPLGDPHNFGKCVCLAGDGKTIVKPRTTTWEWLFLGHDSPLRKSIDNAASQASVPSPISILPCLKFEHTSEILYGRVERLGVQTPRPEHLDDATFRDIGSAIGYLLWFGLTDLHSANTIFGTTPTGKPVFGPVDIECIFEQCYLPSQTHLMPNREMLPENAGLEKVRNFMREHTAPELIASICNGYLDAISFFDAQDRNLMAIFEQKSLSSVPVRIIPRSTRDYYSLLRGGLNRPEPPVAQCEQMQMDRGDIPYFFRRFFYAEALFFANQERVEPADLSQERMTRALALARIPQNGQFHPRKNAVELRKYGALQLARYFDLAENSALFKSGSTIIQYYDRDILIQDGGQLSIGCHRVANAMEKT